MTDRAIARRSQQGDSPVASSCDPQNEAYGFCRLPGGIPQERSPYPPAHDVVSSRYGKAPPQNRQAWDDSDSQLWSDFRASCDIDWNSVITAANEDLQLIRDNLFEVVLGVAAAAGLKFFGGVPGAIIVAAVNKGGPWLIVASRLKDWLWKVWRANGRPENIAEAKRACARFVEAGISAGALSVLGRLKGSRASQTQYPGVPDVRRGQLDARANPLSTAVASKGVVELADGLDPDLIGNDGMPVPLPGGGGFGPYESPEKNSTHRPSLDKIAKRLETTMRVRPRWNATDYGGAQYRSFSDRSEFSGEMSLPKPRSYGDQYTFLEPIWHESHHAYMDNRKLLDGTDSLYLGEIKADSEQHVEKLTDGTVPEPHPVISRRVAKLQLLKEFKDTLIYHHFDREDIKRATRKDVSPTSEPEDWGYASFHSLEELSTFSRGCRQSAGILLQVMALAQTEEEFPGAVIDITGDIFNSAHFALLISEQTRQVTARALRQLKSEGASGTSVRIAPQTRHGVEMVNGVALAVEYDVLHAHQDLVPDGRDGDVSIDMPLANSSSGSALSDYRRRLEDLNRACQVTNAKARELLWALESLMLGFMQDDKAIAMSQAQVVLRIANEIASHARANNSIPLTKPIERRPASYSDYPSFLRHKPEKPIADADLPPTLRKPPGR